VSLKILRKVKTDFRRIKVFESFLFVKQLPVKTKGWCYEIVTTLASVKCPFAEASAVDLTSLRQIKKGSQKQYPGEFT
jgi:hypothetical protein